MKNIFVFLMLLFIHNLSNVQLNAQNSNFLWAIHAGVHNEDDYGNSVTTDTLGNVIITGFFVDSVCFGDTTLYSAGFSDIFITKYDGDSNLIWAQKAGGIGGEYGDAIITDPYGNIIVTGSFRDTASFGDTSIVSAGSGDIFIAKYSSDGGLLWVKGDGGENSQGAYGIGIDDYGNIVVTGFFFLPCSFGDTIITTHGSIDIFVAKYSVDGEFLWVETVGSSNGDDVYDLIIDNDGNIIITGRIGSSTVTFGDTTISFYGCTDFFVAKYDENGNFLWVQQAQGDGAFGRGVTTDNLGNVIVTGKYKGMTIFGNDTLVTPSAGTFPADVFIVKYNSVGGVIWAKRAGGLQDDQGDCIVTDDSGNIYVSGAFRHRADFDGTILLAIDMDDIFIAKYSNTGNLMWIEQAGGMGHDVVNDIDLDGDNNIYIIGSFWEEINFGNIHFSTTWDKYDIFLAKIGEYVSIYTEEKFISSKTYKLKQNYPNPFNPSTTFEFSIPQTEYISIKIYNLLGEEITTLISEKLSAGSYSTVWDATGLPSGVYFYRMSAGKFVQTQKMVLLR